ncbi:unnamed protein product [marine sediment metagenome]|uniref:Fido domain-containing protein n=1 Tax=marine sediment metagenome TaxID=412755 RepID=X1GPF2_9ZZZZ
MIRYLTIGEVLEIYRRVMEQSGGTAGIHNLSGLKSALAQPRMTFGGQDLYASIAEKTAALGFSVINNHPFVDGNKRVGHAVMEVFLMLNGFEIEASAKDQEKVIPDVASGKIERKEFVNWLRNHIVEHSPT